MSGEWDRSKWEGEGTETKVGLDDTKKRFYSGAFHQTRPHLSRLSVASLLCDVGIVLTELVGCLAVQLVIVG